MAEIELPLPSLAGRGDLLRILSHLGEDALQKLAPGMGYEEQLGKPDERLTPAPIPVFLPEPPEPNEHEEKAPEAIGPRYWVPVNREMRLEKNAGIVAPPWLAGVEPLGADHDPNWRAPPWQPLVPWSRLLPWLRRRLGNQRPSRQSDMARIVKSIATGRPLRHMPELTRSGWASRITILLGHEPELWPYQEDMNRLWTRLAQIRGASHLDVFVLEGPPGVRPQVRKAGDFRVHAWNHPAPDVPLLILGDLGLLVSDSETKAGWLRFGLAQVRAGLTPVALCPVPAGRVSAALARTFEIHEWDGAARIALPVRAGGEEDEARHQTIMDKMLDRLAPALSVEGALLRAVRRDLGGHAMLESAILRHPDAVAAGSRLLPAGAEARERRLAVFAGLPRATQRRMAERLFAHHGSTPSQAMTERRAIEFATRHLPEAEALEVVTQEERATSLAWHQRLVRRALVAGNDFLMRTWLPYNLASQGDAVVASSKESRALWAISQRNLLRKGEKLELPPWASEPDLRFFLESGVQQARHCVIFQRGQGLFLADALPTNGIRLAEGTLLGSHLHMSVLTDRGRTHYAVPDTHGQLLELSPDIQSLTLDMGAVCFEFKPVLKPDWASSIRQDGDGLVALLPDGSKSHWRMANGKLPAGWDIGGWRNPDNIGRDKFGVFAEFSVVGAVQKVRWIPAGRFLMGSSKDEEYRGSNETQHEVALSGYWLADTACTQELWQAVMGDNPAMFKDDVRNPVEQVSWDDCREFFGKLNALVPGLNAGFPSEAQWEYACRAGTKTAYSFGNKFDPKLVNIGNKTVPVASLPTNPWGIYEMHGNVFEWCADWFGSYEAELQTDPEGPPGGSSRVLRGGSWFGDARYLRSAYRYRYDPGFRYAFIGLRVAPGRAGPAEPAKARGTRAASFLSDSSS